MDFLEFLKSSCHDSYVKFDLRDNKIFQWQTSIDTGFSLNRLNQYYIRVDYCGSATKYSLEPNSWGYQIKKGGSYTGYDLCDSGYGDLRLYYGGSLYGQAEYMKEKEEREREEAAAHSSSTSSSSSSADYFSNGFWSWKSYGMAWLISIVPLVVVNFMGIVGIIIMIAFVAFMGLWAILLAIHRGRHGK